VAEEQGLRCAEVRELLGELAADVADGDERARALGHLSGCPDCRRELAATAEVVDELLLLAPEHEPPVGFETAVLARMVPAAPRRRRWQRLLVAAAAMVVVAALAAGGVWWRTAGDRELAGDYRHTLAIAHGRGLSAAPLLLAGGAETGTVFAYQGAPSWVYVTFRSAPPKGRYDVRMVTRDGRRMALRPFTATARPAPAAWGSTVEVPIDQIRTIEFVRLDAPVMTATFA
jgi:Putative zinc-finger